MVIPAVRWSFRINYFLQFILLPFGIRGSLFLAQRQMICHDLLYLSLMLIGHALLAFV